ncbi:zinc finger MYM-type protein 5-like [Hydra vulgaris]|uniref:Zinc finger MYM-type protein 5-like n=1 Tax=Hydra vulgaris TaxID=6087 RepID=A0ABM4CUC3_HYDVU
MTGRKYKSGCQKRKLAEQKQDAIKKCKTLTNFFSIQSQIDETSSAQIKDKNNDQNVSIFESSEIQTSPYIVELPSEDNFCDLGTWPDILNSDFINFCLTKDTTYFQNKGFHKRDYAALCRISKTQNRYFSEELFKKRLKNAHPVSRNWICYSKSTGNIYCLMCKLFFINVQAFSKGFSDWKHGEEYVILHENSTPHKNAVINWTTRKERKNTIDKQIMQELEQESDKFYKILKRVVAVVKFLSDRGLAFRFTMKHLVFQIMAILWAVWN